MNTTNKIRGPLAGVVVIDFGHYYAGPMVGMLLADQGANVIRIVKPGEKELPEQQYRVINRNKKLLPLDLKTEEGKQRALSLIAKADVVIENFRPGVMRRLGLDYASVKNSNPGLVYLSLPGFASTDKERAHIQAWEGVLNAAAAVYTMTSPIREDLRFPPLYTWIPQCSIQGAMHGAIAITAALMAREDKGVGAIVEVPLVDAGLSPFSGYLNMPFDSEAELPQALKPFGYQAGDSTEVQQEKLAKGMRANKGKVCPPFYGIPYTCADGRKILIWAVDSQAGMARLFKTMGIYKQLVSEGFVNEGPWVSGFDNNYSNMAELSPQRVRRLMEILSATFATKTGDEWEAILESLNIPGTYARTRDEWLALEPMHASGIFARMNNGKSELVVPGRMVDVSGPEETIEEFLPSEPVPVAEDAELLSGDVTTRQAYSGKFSLKKSDLLRGLKVLDLTNIVAGPTSTYTLAQYGAEVIKADPPAYAHPGLYVGTREINQGKRSIMTDITTEPGREILRRLVYWADVVVHNSLDNTAERFGVRREQIQAINPNAVVCQFSAFGGSYRNSGGWENRTGFDPLAQYASGMMVHYGSEEHPHSHGAIGVDTMGGLGLAFSAVLGCYQKKRTGYAGEGRTSLASMVNFMQLPCMISENGNSNWGEARGQFALGESPWQRLYRSADAWIYVGATEALAATMAEVVTGQSVQNSGELDTQVLESAFRAQDCAYWEQKLEAANIACHRVLRQNDLANAHRRSVDNERSEETANNTHEILCWDDHPWGAPFVSVASNWVRVGEDRTYLRLKTAPRFGQDTREILEELGYDDKQIDRLIQLKISHEYLPELGDKETYFYTQGKH